VSAEWDLQVVREELERRAAERRERAQAARPGSRVQSHLDGQAAGLEEAAEVTRGQVF
jgi:hypothetical protein